ncbi:MAG TPA: gamma-glutamyltransferase [Vicinamibacterales bacterium]|jgi:gamma-glutamyltranspeptidase/glutathione hydrolase
MTLRHPIAPGDRPAGNPRGTRSAVMARHGMIATSQPLAAAAGLVVLRDGGNAVDAAVTAAAVLSVVEPTMTGVGGDLFALVFDARTGRLRGLNASGRAGRAASCAALRDRGYQAVPLRGPLSVTVPGAVDGWAELLAAHGRVSLARALAPAITYAREGFPVSEIVAGQWQAVEAVLAQDDVTAGVFLPGGRAPRAGEIFTNPGLARTLEDIADGGRDAFYRGPIAATVVRHLQERGGLLDALDFAGHRATWVDPIHTTFRGCEIFELPPNTQGLVALEMLNILEGEGLATLGHNSAALLHVIIEAKRLAFADRDAWLADPDHLPPGLVERLISKEYAAERRRLIDPRRRADVFEPGIGRPRREGPRGLPPSAAGDTVYLTAVDGDGNAVSLIQSLFESFGSALVAPGTGIALQNRGSLFVLEDDHPNAIGPAKRPLHTIIPAMAFRAGRPFLSFGVMGGDLQPQGHVQVLINLLEFGMSVQEAGEAARIRHSAAGVAVESGISAEARAGLADRGHVLVDTPGVFGGFQGIQVDADHGILIAGSDPRKDGLAIGY